MQFTRNSQFLLIGNGAYLAGESFSLSAPANDVCRFAEFLLKRDVTGKQICVYVAPRSNQREVIFKTLERLRGLAADRQFRQEYSGPVDHSQVVEALQEIRGVEADRLVILWSGHGFLPVGDEADSRALLYSNYSNENRLAMDFKSLLRHLRTTPGYPSEQIFFIDACANSYNDLQQGVSLAPLGFSMANGQADAVSQFVMYATHADGTARSRSESRFISEVLWAMSELPASQNWHELFATVLERIKHSGSIATNDLPDWVCVSAPASIKHDWIRGYHLSGCQPPAAAGTSPFVNIDQLPRPLAAHWVVSPARSALLDEINRDTTKTTVFLYGEAGIGKSTLVRTWIETRISGSEQQPVSVFAWSFADQEVAQGSIFARGALKHFGDATGDSIKTPSGITPRQLGNLAAEHFMRRGGVLILDALDSLQDGSVDGGEVNDECLKAFLHKYFALSVLSHPGHTQLVITSRWPPESLTAAGKNARVLCRPLPPLEQATSVDFLHGIKLRGKTLQNLNGDTIRKIAERCDGHPLTLLLAASFLVASEETSKKLEIELFPAGVDDKAHLHAANVMNQYDTLFSNSDREILRTARGILLLLAELSVPVDKEIIASGWQSLFGGEGHEGNNAKPAYSVDFAIDYLAEMGLLKVSKSEVTSHQLVGAYYREMREAHRPVSRRDLCRALFQTLTQAKWGENLRAASTELRLNSLRLGVLAGQADKSYHLVLEPYFLRNPDQSTIMDYDVVESALFSFFPNDWSAITAELAPFAQIRVLMEADILLSVRYGYSSVQATTVQSQLASIADAPSSQADLASFQRRRVHTALAQWRSAFFSGRCDDAAQLAKSFYESDRSLDQFAPVLSLVGLRMMTASLYFIGEHRKASDLMRRVFEFEKMEYRWSEFGDTMDPAVSCLGFGAMSSLIIGEGRLAEESHRESLNRAKAGSPYTRCVALHLAQSYAYLRGDHVSTLDFACQLKNVANEKAFAAWSAAADIFRGWAISQGGDPGTETQRPHELIETGIRRWRMTGARITLGYWYLIAAEVFLKEGLLANAASHIEAARGELSYSHERWYEALLYNQMALFERAKNGESPLFEEAARCARASAINSGAVMFLQRIDGDFQSSGANASDSNR